MTQPRLNDNIMDHLLGVMEEIWPGDLTDGEPADRQRVAHLFSQAYQFGWNDRQAAYEKHLQTKYVALLEDSLLFGNRVKPGAQPKWTQEVERQPE